jgi:hypothetical protein
MNDEFDSIRRLIRLKRHETPGELFTEQFLEQFHRRQQQESQRKTPLQAFLKNLHDRIEAVINPKWAMAAVAATVIALGVWLAAPAAAPQGSQMADQASKKDQAKLVTDKKAAEDEAEDADSTGKPTGVAIPASHALPPDEEKEEK